MDANNFNAFIQQLKDQHGFVNMEILPLKHHLGLLYFDGEDTRSGMKVFVKMDGTFGEAAEREAYMIQQLTSETRSELLFPRLVAYGVDAPYPYVALEWIQGITLEECLQNQYILSDSQKRELLQHMVEMLTILHQSQIIHRDIRPANIMVSLEGDRLRATLIDFAFSIGLNDDFLSELPFLLERRHLLMDLGGIEYKPDIFKWDDAYSLCKVALMIDMDYPQKFPDLWKQFCSFFNKTVYKYL